jgi:hypothetical protein
MAGVMALINQKAGTTQGNPNSGLYALAAKQNYSNCKTETVTNFGSCYFNDVDTGTINMPCAANSPNCTVASSGYTIGILSGFDAGTGFDNATGLGSLNVANVVNGWTSSIGTVVATVTVTPMHASIMANQSLSVAVTVAGSSGTPTGAVTLSGGGYTSSVQALSSGTTTFTIPKNSLSTGSITFTANYGGDPTYAIATGSSTVTVTAPPIPTVTVTPASSTIIVNQSLSVPVTVSGTSGTATGTVTLSGGDYTSSAQALSAGSTTFLIPANSLTLGTDTLTATYIGDSTYGGNTGIAQVTVNALPKPTVTVSPVSNTIIVNQSLSVPVTVSGTSGTATGNVTLSGGGHTSSQSLSAGSTTFLIPANSLTVGTDTLTATYIGDPNYSGNTGTAQVIVNAVPKPTVTVSPASDAITVNQSLNVGISVAGTSGTATGNVTLSGGGYTSSQSLSAGRTTFLIPANSLSVGLDTLAANYTGDSIYGSNAGSAQVSVTQPASTVTVSANPSSFTSAQGTTITVTVSGSGGTPTGSVNLTSGNFTSVTKSLSGGSATFNISSGVLAVGTDTITARYGGDSTFAVATGSTQVIVSQAQLLTPTVVVSPASSGISVNQGLSVTATIGGTGPTPSGTVTLSGGGYTPSGQTLVSGATTFAIPANSLTVGIDTLAVNYGGDANYTSGTGSANVTVNTVSQGSPEGAYLGTASTGKTFETIILPDNTFYALYGTTSGNVFTVSGMIMGKGNVSNGTLTASITDYYSTGTVYGTVSATYVAGSSVSGTITESSVGTISFTATAIPASQYNFNSAASPSQISGNWAGALLGGVAASATVSSNGSFTGSSQGCSYSGTATPDGSGKNFLDFSITFGASGCVAPNQTFTGIALEYLLSDGVTRQLLAAFSSATAGEVFIGTPSGSLASGTFQLGSSTPASIHAGGSATSAITMTPSNGYSGSVTLSCALTSGPSNQAGDAPACTPQASAITVGSAGNVTVTTKATNAAALQRPHIGKWFEADSGALLALLVFFGIPARRRACRAVLGTLVLLFAFGGLMACGGGGPSNTGGGGGGNPGTASGTYIFTVTGTGNPAVTPAPTTTFSVVVN